MSDPPLPGLLDRAYKVFSLAGKLGRAFHEEHKAQAASRQVDAAAWNRFAPTFAAFCEGLLKLRDAMQNPPDGFAPVAAQLFDAGRVAKAIRDEMQHPDGRTWATYLEFYSALNSVFDDGSQAVLKVIRAHGLDDPFSFVLDDVPTANEAVPANPVVQPPDATACLPTDTAAEPESEPVPDSQSGFLGGAALADALGVHPTQRDAFFQRLRRKRMSLPDECWNEVLEPRHRSPRFLYRVDSPELRELVTAYKRPKLF